MAHQILLYISAGSDLAAEREVLGRAITEIPVDLGWLIVQTPIGGGRIDRDAIEMADLHLFLLGSDVRAPVGYEWHLAREADRWPIPLLHYGVSRTPAASAFERYIRFQAPWFHYRDPADLRRRVLRLLSGYILGHATDFKLSLVEMETLAGWRKVLSNKPVDQETIGGAGSGGVLLSQSRHRPLDGVPLEEPLPQPSDGPWPDIDLDWLDFDDETV